MVTEHKKNIDILTKTLPPVRNAIGEHSEKIAIELAKTCNVKIYCNSDEFVSGIPNVTVVQSFTNGGRGRFANLLELIVNSESNRLLLQYNPFCWGRRGWAMDLVSLLRDVKFCRRDLVFAVMFHEIYNMSPGIKSWVMRLYQKHQFRSLVASADVCFFSTDTWRKKFLIDYPLKHFVDLGVGSNLPKSSLNYDDARLRFGYTSREFICCVFGGDHPSRLFDMIESAFAAITTKLRGSKTVRLVCIGHSRHKWKDSNNNVQTLGWLAPQEAADTIVAADLLINPFSDGVSTRRGSVMAALQHGVPVMTTDGICTEDIWQKLANKGVLLGTLNSSGDWERSAVVFCKSVISNRLEYSTNLRSFYEQNFDWPVTASKLIREIG
jgi:glycosyltransferase involved in cell wall biosynthesis